MPPVFSSVACNLDRNLLAACFPLFESGRVDALEWSFDTLYQIEVLPDWFEALLQAYSGEGRLIGHGVFFSLFSGKWSTNQEQWLSELRHLCRRYKFDHITEHFGFMTGRNFHHGAPLNIPFTETTLAIGRDRLLRISDACKCPVGIENLAFAYSSDEVKRHGGFLSQLVEEVNGFIILDLHNLFCQLANFEVAPEELINAYPLERVREIHISGGSWEESEITANKKVRRDTHDGKVPLEVFALLEKVLPDCPNLKFVVFEQLGNSLDSAESQQLFQQDFSIMEQIVGRSNMPDIAGNDFRNVRLPLQQVVEDELLYHQQIELSAILENAVSYKEAIAQLRTSSLACSSWNIESWQPHMIETAVNIARKWKGAS